MSEKELIILAGIVLFLAWRGSAMTQAVTQAAPGNPTAPVTTSWTGFSAGNSVAYGGPVNPIGGPMN
jgi:hypothetical protein